MQYRNGLYRYPYGNVDERIKRQVWAKGSVIPGYSPDEWRRDTCGAAMRYGDHGAEGKYGWEIDHIYRACPDFCV
jgi:hypothetical protein